MFFFFKKTYIWKKEVSLSILMKEFRFAELSATEQHCLRQMALLPSKPEPLPNLWFFFQLEREFVPDLADLYIQNVWAKNFWAKTKHFLSISFRLLRQLFIYEKLNQEQVFEQTIRNLARKKWLIENQMGFQINPILLLRVREKVKQNLHQSVVVLDSIGQLLSFEEDEEADLALFYLPYAEHALKVLDNVKQPAVAKLASITARLYSVMGNYRKAIKYQMLDIKVSESLMSAQDIELAFGYGLLAIYFYYAENYASAKDYIERSMQIFKQNVSEDDEDFRNALAWRKDIYEAYENNQL